MRLKQIDAIISDCLTSIRRKYSGSSAPDERAISKDVAEELFEKKYFYLKLSERRYIRSEVVNAILHYDVLTGLLDDDAVTEIMVNGWQKVYVESRGRLSLSDIHFRSEEDAVEFSRKLISTVSQSKPIGNARMTDRDFRVNVVLNPVALDSPVITIRKFSKKPMSIDMLIRYGSITAEVADKLEKLVRAKYNIFVSGGTGSGKTTFLNALSNFIPSTERVITIEDPAELQLESVKNLVRLETRNAIASGSSEKPIDITELIRTALRMRPDRIVVGEVRGPEALDMLQAMNTGHEGSMSTGHANSSRGMLRRLEALVMSGEAGGKLPLPVIRTQIAESLDVMVHLGRLRDGSRHTLEINEVLGIEDGEIRLNPLYRFEETGEDAAGRIQGTLRRTENPFHNVEKLRFAGIKDEF